MYLKNKLYIKYYKCVKAQIIEILRILIKQILIDICLWKVRGSSHVFLLTYRSQKLA